MNRAVKILAKELGIPTKGIEKRRPLTIKAMKEIAWQAWKIQQVKVYQQMSDMGTVNDFDSLPERLKSDIKTTFEK